MKKDFISIKVSSHTYAQFIDKTLELINKKKSSYICVANIHMLVEAYQDEDFATIVNSADLCAPDGMPLAWGMRLLYGEKQDRVCGMDLLPDLLAQSEIKGIPVFFYGGSNEMLVKNQAFLDEKHPKLNTAGMLSPPFRQLSPKEEAEHVDMINGSGAKFLVVALGCPKQEKWMARMKGKIQMPMIGIGGALPVMIGLQKRAPVWMQKTSLEWLFRLMQEPKRLMKRYFVTNTVFLFLFCLELAASKRPNIKATLN
ncbi:WecB/TagA/CpsF family glycosyltransferase [Dyadobacter arcticus]|uniref:N-acetylglucosaminyldiphosphoundecaprenol N-acetyl-beta-D-mannosaminyltransferase n=1 Tax=Dyadobacter arcticus TaxID=1078754 RepID=A0ABX0UPP0_9BACT|nr:WecB/TagA/CpsF family glycosyltransferase [Dyadobacter arcticus]NIJ54968.1 N-acetylglucosaminyldiphosphoundecaprenol N-acetyl-beta-D-mannosaminyltransferase [Dyadobacter arcticus]